jgi:hypothetical protein
MNKRGVARKLCERVPGLLNHGVYFFHERYDWVLRGVVLEYVPTGVYLWDFSFPLHDFFGPNLNYSHRLRETTFISKGAMSAERLVDRIVASSELSDALSHGEPTTLQEFVQQFSQSSALATPHGYLIRAATKLLVGEPSIARAMLEQLPPMMHPNDVKSAIAFRDRLLVSDEAGANLLDTVRTENLVKFGVQPRVMR